MSEPLNTVWVDKTEPAISKAWLDRVQGAILGLEGLPVTITRGAGTTVGTLAVTAVGPQRILSAVSIRAAGTSTLIGTLATADRPAVTVLGGGVLTDPTAANGWPVKVHSDGSLHLLVSPPAGTLLSGSIHWRAA